MIDSPAHEGNLTRPVLPRGGECECRACDRTFTSLSGFDWHQWWYGRKGDEAHFACLDPAELGMVAEERKGRPVWRFPGREEGGPSADLRNALIDRIAQILGVPAPRRRGSVG